MKVGILCLQGAFREHREVLDVARRRGGRRAHARAAGRARRADPARRRVDHHEQAARLVVVARRRGRRARRRPAGARHVRGHDPAGPRGRRRSPRSAARSRPSTSRCGATPTDDSAIRSRRCSTSSGSPVGPFRACSSGRPASSTPATTSRCWPGTTATPCSPGRAGSGSRASTPSCRVTSGCTHAS